MDNPIVASKTKLEPEPEQGANQRTDTVRSFFKISSGNKNSEILLLCGQKDAVINLGGKKST